MIQPTTTLVFTSLSLKGSKNQGNRKACISQFLLVAAQLFGRSCLYIECLMLLLGPLPKILIRPICKLSDLPYQATDISFEAITIQFRASLSSQAVVDSTVHRSRDSPLLSVFRGTEGDRVSLQGHSAGCSLCFTGMLGGEWVLRIREMKSSKRGLESDDLGQRHTASINHGVCECERGNGARWRIKNTF